MGNDTSRWQGCQWSKHFEENEKRKEKGRISKSAPKLRKTAQVISKVYVLGDPAQPAVSPKETS